MRFRRLRIGRWRKNKTLVEPAFVLSLLFPFPLFPLTLPCPLPFPPLFAGSTCPPFPTKAAASDRRPSAKVPKHARLSGTSLVAFNLVPTEVLLRVVSLPSRNTQYKRISWFNPAGSWGWFLPVCCSSMFFCRNRAASGVQNFFLNSNNGFSSHWDSSSFSAIETYSDSMLRDDRLVGSSIKARNSSNFCSEVRADWYFCKSPGRSPAFWVDDSTWITQWNQSPYLN